MLGDEVGGRLYSHRIVDVDPFDRRWLQVLFFTAKIPRQGHSNTFDETGPQNPVSPKLGVAVFGTLLSIYAVADPVYFQFQ